MMPSGIISAISLILFYINLCHTLECYVCDNQENNLEKCVKSLRTCEQDEDVCLTEVRWGSMPYWQQGALKQFYISKRCATLDACARYRGSNMPLCTHVWYEDWKCSECCKGDRCNYYYISGAKATIRSFNILSLIVLVSVVSIYYLT